MKLFAQLVNRRNRLKFPAASGRQPESRKAELVRPAKRGDNPFAGRKLARALLVAAPLTTPYLFDSRPTHEIAALARPDALHLSVILSTYTRGPSLNDAIRSVLAQHEATTPPFELIVLDNTSTHGTSEI